MTDTEPTADVLVAEARRAVHECLSLLPAWDADRVRSLITDLETAVELRTEARATTPAGPAPATDRDTLRERIARALVRYDWNAGLSGRDTPSEHHYGEADAVLAVLPAPDQQTAEVERWRQKYHLEHARHVEVVRALVTDRTAVLHEAADSLAQMRIGAEDPDPDEHVRGYNNALDHAEAELRRLAGEAQQDGPTDDCTCAAAGEAFRPAGHYRDCPQYVREARQDPAQDGKAAALLSTPCDACDHTLNWHRNDVGCTVPRCVCGRWQPTVVVRSGRPDTD
ncbi:MULTISPECIES: hypothetical protein [unclassified Streptomyces]|uniref:hypothetical protein n=1 Tax=unclassified Streptomyces TaxID=2593676 RepID=UPI000562AEEA|nr:MULTISPECIES: hypothetical protein [unclassified Streptomyces]KOV86089.1 hypothetical protein ADL02_19560 [Streptomyces sp. NRRL WC-3723]